MQTIDVQDKFIELRASGLSYDKIAQQLSVSKQTLINWSKEYRKVIANLRSIEKEALLERLELTEKVRLERISMMLNKIQDELAKRDLSQVPTDKLSELYIKFLELNKKAILPVVLSQPEIELNIIPETTWKED